MASRSVHWSEGMFLRPHHFQAADRHARESLRESEDWFRPFNWGLRRVEFDRDAIGNESARLLACEARFKDGTKVAIPAEASVDPVELKAALAASAAVTIYLAVPSYQPSRANVQEAPTADGPRFWVDEQECRDENTGAGEEPIQVRRLRARLLLSTQDTTGYEVLPLARVERSAQAGAPPRLVASYVPPLICLDAWPPLWREVQSLHSRIDAHIKRMAAQLVDRKISFDSQVPGDAERLLKLAVLNGASGFMAATVFVPGLAPLGIYQELCRLVGQLALFSDNRRPPDLPSYDHEDIGGCFALAIREIQDRLGDVSRQAFEKRYFLRVGERLQVALEPEWLIETKRLYLGVETDLSDQECQDLLGAMELKLGSGAQAEQIFLRRLRGLRLLPVTRPPRELPAGQGVVYFQVERDPIFWKDVGDTYTLGIRMNLNRAAFQGDQMLAVTSPAGKATNLQFALYII
ncbi:type VI secretion system baseplate subunit TssK [Tundrisphaera sp. TA3]|uniref:type VI secretion system baseplate subunit TssK n=1 Tax=Tundrisphaera sp. TA3 TaxID=3435775 RepID=UPI003EBCE769